MASAEARTTALLFSFSAVALLLLALQPPPQNQTRRHGADLVVAALERFLDGRAVLRLATRTNMVLLCHAILLLILRDAGVLGAPARRRAANPAVGAATIAPTIAVAADSGVEQDTCSANARSVVVERDTCSACTRSVVVWRDSATNADAGETGRRRPDKRQQRRSPRPAAAPALTTQEPEQAERQRQVSSREIVLVAKPTTNHLPDDNLDRRGVVAGHGTYASAAAEEKVELADDRRIEEFIANQWSMMRQESLQLVRTAGSSQQAITT